MRMKKIFLVLVLLFLTKIHAFNIQIPVHYDTLKNGLRIIIVPDTNVAVVSCRLYYFMGSIYEGPGSSGLSHMYEHMMFKGTKRMGTTNYAKELKYMTSIDSLDALICKLREKGVPETDSLFSNYRKQIFSILEKQRKYIKKDEIWETYLNNGGTHLNAWTSDDITAYIVTLPQNKLELFCWIEADRMQNPVLREFYSERDVVTEERRMRYENRPMGKYWEQLNAHFYVAHPYRIPTIGWMSDIRSYTREKMYDHINRYYTPDNGLIVLVGNVKSDAAMKLIRQYFWPISRAKEPKQEVVTREPAPIGETRFTLYEEAQPRIDIMYHTPGYPHDDLYNLDVIEGILSGRSGRLYKRLVDEEKLCINTGAGNSFRLHSGYFHVWATPKTDVNPEKVEEVLLDEIDKLLTKQPTKREMERIKNTIQMHFVTQLKSLEHLSDQLAMFERLRTWKDLLKYPEKIAMVTPETISAIAKRYFSPELKTIGRLLQKEESRKKSEASNQ
jgi:predicted Zn-dependent peptidase